MTSNRSNIFIPAAVLLLIAVLLTVSCSMDGVVQDVTPNISLKGLPAQVESVDISVTGPGISMSQSLPPGTLGLILPFPPANGVFFDIEAPVNAAYVGPVLSFGEGKTVDLSPGQSLDLNFVMGPYETKILVADPNGSNQYVDQFDSMSVNDNQPTSPYWIQKSFVVSPWDVELDNQGRIWVALATSPDGLVRYETIDSPTATYTSTTVFNARALAMDRVNSRMYYLHKPDGIILGRIPISSLTVGSSEDIDIEAEPDIDYIAQTALAVDDEGYVYLLGFLNPSIADAVFKIDPDAPAGSRVIKTFSQYLNFVDDPEYLPAGDILYKNNYIYVLNPGGADGKKVLQFDKDLNYIKGFGNQETTYPQTRQNYFYGPIRFVATSRKKFYIADDGYNNETVSNFWLNARIVSFSDMNGNQWETYQPVDSNGYSLFKFYGS